MTKPRKYGGRARFAPIEDAAGTWSVTDRGDGLTVASGLTRGMARRVARQQNRAYHPAPRPKVFHREA